MSTLDEIAKEKQRIGEALARADAQREKLTGQLSELEATERVLARYSKGTQTKKAAAAKTPTATTKAAPVQSRGRRRPTIEKPAGGKGSSSSLGAASVVGAGSFPRSFLIPGTDTSIRIGRLLSTPA